MTTPIRFRPIFAWSLVVLLTFAYILSNIDRQLISVLIGPIQRDLAISDTEFGSLQGLAYGLVYAAFCIPIAGLSDRFSRSLVISVGLAFWSAATLASGIATSFSHLFIARALVGLGESSLLPAVYSLIGDVFPREKLGRAMGVYSLGPFLGSSLAFLLGGAAFHWLGEDTRHNIFGFHAHTWQVTFLLAATPGLILAAVIGLTIRDPRSAASRQREKPKQAPFSDVLRYLRQKRGIFIPHFLGFLLLAQSLYATLGWATAYLTRTGNISTAEAGLWMGTTSLIAGGLGALGAGFLTDALVNRRHNSGAFEVGMVAALALAICTIWTIMFPAYSSSFVIIAGAIFFGSFSMAPSIAVIQAIVPSHLRSRVSSIFLLVNMLGQAFASFTVGFLNDHVYGGPHGISQSLPTMIAVATVVSFFVLASGRKNLAAAMSEGG